MNFPDAVKSGFSKYVTFSGRAARSEYWFWVLFVFIGSFCCALIDRGVFGMSQGPLNGIFGLATLLPYISVGVRRLHDLNKSGWWLLLSAVGLPFLIIPPLAALIFLGTSILMIVWFCTKGTEGSNRFGPDPLAQPMVG